MNEESWLYIDSEVAHLWDYFIGPSSAVTNTELLFTAASRPHADFFMEKVTRAVGAEGVELTSITDSSWRSLLEAKFKHGMSIEALRVEATSIDPAKTVLITRPDAMLGKLNLPAGIKTYVVDDKELLLNIEPAWRKLRAKLNGSAFETALVNLGPGRVLVLPRLAQVFHCRAIDVTPFAEQLPPHKPHLLKRIRRKIQAMLPHY